MGGEPLACDGRVRSDVGASLLDSAVGVGEGAVADGFGVGVVDAASEDGLTSFAG